MQPQARPSRRDSWCVRGGTKGWSPSRSLSLFKRPEHCSAPLRVAGPSRSKPPRDISAKLYFIYLFFLRQEGGKPHQRSRCCGAHRGRLQDACAQTLLSCTSWEGPGLIRSQEPWVSRQDALAGRPRRAVPAPPGGVRVPCRGGSPAVIVPCSPRTGPAPVRTLPGARRAAVIFSVSQPGPCGTRQGGRGGSIVLPSHVLSALQRGTAEPGRGARGRGAPRTPALTQSHAAPRETASPDPAGSTVPLSHVLTPTPNKK